MLSVASFVGPNSLKIVHNLLSFTAASFIFCSYISNLYSPNFKFNFSLAAVSFANSLACSALFISPPSPNTTLILTVAKIINIIIVTTNAINVIPFVLCFFFVF